MSIFYLHNNPQLKNDTQINVVLNEKNKLITPLFEASHSNPLIVMDISIFEDIFIRTARHTPLKLTEK